MSTLELEHIKHASSSSNNFSVHSDGSLTLGSLNGNIHAGTMGVGHTASPTSYGDGNTMFSIHKNTTNGSVNALIGTDTVKGGMYVNNTGSDNEIKFGTVSNYPTKVMSNGVTGVEVNGNGYVLKPQTPACFAFKSGSGNNAAAHDGANALNTTGLNNGNHFNTSTGRFTCPVAGMYMVCWTMMNSQSNTGTAVCVLRVNGSGYKYFHVENSHPQGQSDQLIYNANANDYFDISLTNYHWNGGSTFKYPSMSVFLIG